MWKDFSKENAKSVLTFLKEHEWFCISIFSNVTKNNKIQIKEFFRHLVFYENKSKISSLIFYKNGFLFPIIKYEDLLDTSWFSMLGISYVFSVMGRRDDVKNLSSYLSTPIKDEKEYFIMTCKNVNLFKNSNERFEIKNTKFSDLKKLYKIQKEYLLEEVYTSKSDISSQTIQESLAKTDNRIIYLKDKNKNLIFAKAAINCVGIKYCQLGGVFTKKEYRNKGFSKYLVSTLCNYFFKKGFFITLFVKIKNEPAIKAYQDIGFEKRCEFNIIYY